MKFIEWCGLLEIGHFQIDEQHQKLFDIANRFHDQIGKNKDQTLVVETLNQLVQYAQFHFAEEERLLQKLNFPADSLAKHKRTHERLLIQIFDLHAKFAKGTKSTLPEIQQFLNEWLIQHILIEDKKYIGYLVRD
jgi:hemerythrin